MVVTDSTEWPSAPVYVFKWCSSTWSVESWEATCFKFPYNKTQKIMGRAVANIKNENWQHQQAEVRQFPHCSVKLASCWQSCSHKDYCWIGKTNISAHNPETIFMFLKLPSTSLKNGLSLPNVFYVPDRLTTFQVLILP